jgi:hypothetical protein
MKSSDFQQLRDQALATEAADWFFRVNREYRFTISRPVSSLLKFKEKFGPSNGANWLDMGGVYFYFRTEFFEDANSWTFWVDYEPGKEVVSRMQNIDEFPIICAFKRDEDAVLASLII